MSRALSIFQGSLGRVALLQMNQSLVNHAHRGCHVLLKVGGVDTHFEVRGKLCALTDGSAVLVNAWEPHSYVHVENTLPSNILALYIDPFWLASIDRKLAVSGSSGFFPRPQVEIGRRIRQRTLDLGQRMQGGESIDLSDAEAIIFDLMKEIIDGFANLDANNLHGKPPVETDSRIRRAIRLMQEHVHAPFDARTLARDVGMSRPHFFARFRDVVGLTPALFFNTLRMEAATRLLADAHLPVARVAHDLGFSAHANFARFFRQHQGVAPTQYQRVARFVE